MALNDEHLALGIGGDASGAAEATAHGDHLTLRCDLHGPPAEEVTGLVRSAEAQRHPDITLWVVLGGEGELMALGVAPIVGEGFVAIRDAIAFGVTDAQDLAEGSRRHRAIFPRQGEDLILTGRKEVELWLRWRGEGSLDEVDVAAARSHRESPIGQDFEAARSHGNRRGNRDIDDGVILRLRGGGAPHGA